ncbi:sugar isomerase domain-containing protein [Nocardiopsis oceani]
MSPDHSTTALGRAAAQYTQQVQQLLAEALDAEQGHIAEAAALLAERFAADGILYVFGSGHSHVFAEEGFFRAGGSARICPVLKPDYMLHVSAERGTVLERESGHAANVLAGYEINPDTDAMLVVSNSGANALPVEVAQTARDRGLPVIAITSRAYATASTQTGPKLHEVADIVLDNHCPPGDALVSVREDLPLAGPGSSVVGLALLNAMIVAAAEKEAEQGGTPRVFLSAGMPDAAEHNARIIAEMGPRVPHI